VSTISRISVDEYDRMIRRGVFDGVNRRRIELIYGELRDMTPIGPSHAFVVDLLNRWSVKHVPEDQTLVRIQNSIEMLDLASVPEPDVAWVVNGRYDERHPNPKEVLLVIEVADSSLTIDMQDKAILYATAKIADYWVVDLVNLCVQVLRDPYRGRYRSRRTFHPGNTIWPLAFERLKFPVSLLFAGD
jgi:Uma2 family endonuclease